MRQAILRACPCVPIQLVDHVETCVSVGAIVALFAQVMFRSYELLSRPSNRRGVLVAHDPEQSFHRLDDPSSRALGLASSATRPQKYPQANVMATAPMPNKKLLSDSIGSTCPSRFKNAHRAPAMPGPAKPCPAVPCRAMPKLLPNSVG